MNTYTIAGVNEHFNFPWKYGILSGAFFQRGLSLNWSDIPGGTGEMLRLLDDGKLDFAVLLTEGILSDIIRKKNSKLLQLHVKTPLLWGVHVRKEYSHLTLSQLSRMRFAISRYGSGSHMMVLVLAKQQGWKISDLKFEVVNSLEGGLRSLQSGESDVFLWEKYTTRPFLEKSGLAWIGEVPTPWPAFCLTASEKICNENPAIVKQVMKAGAELNAVYSEDPETIKRISEMFHLSEFEVENWKKETQWNTAPGITDRDLINILGQLQKTGLITESEALTSPAEIKFGQLDP